MAAGTSRDPEAGSGGWRARTKHGSKGGRRAAARGDWLRDMAPVAKARYTRDANLKALYGISLPLYEELLHQQGVQSCSIEQHNMS